MGVAEKKKLIDGSHDPEGDIVLGLASSGFHSNGYSLVRRVLEANDCRLGDSFPHFEESIADTLLKPTRIYVRSVLQPAGGGRAGAGHGAHHRAAG